MKQSVKKIIIAENYKKKLEEMPCLKIVDMMGPREKEQKDFWVIKHEKLSSERYIDKA